MNLFMTWPGIVIYVFLLFGVGYASAEKGETFIVNDDMQGLIALRDFVGSENLGGSEVCDRRLISNFDADKIYRYYYSDKPICADEILAFRRALDGAASFEPFFCDTERNSLHRDAQWSIYQELLEKVLRASEALLLCFR